MVALTQVLALAIEIAAVWSFCRIGSFLAPAGVASLLAGSVGAGIVVAAWWRWAAPKSPTRLQGMSLLAFKALVFSLAVLFLAVSGQNVSAALLAAACLAYLALSLRLNVQ